MGYCKAATTRTGRAKVVVEKVTGAKMKVAGRCCCNNNALAS